MSLSCYVFAYFDRSGWPYQLKVNQSNDFRDFKMFILPQFTRMIDKKVNTRKWPNARFSKVKFSPLWWTRSQCWCHEASCSEVILYWYSFDYFFPVIYQEWPCGSGCGIPICSRFHENSLYSPLIVLIWFEKVNSLADPLKAWRPLWRQNDKVEHGC